MKKIIASIGFMVALFHSDAQTLRIMPLGNSITQAESSRLSYRYPLWQKLRTANVNMDFVGSLNTNFGGSPVFPDPNFDRNHEGHWGWRADEMLAGLPQWLGGYTPDVVLMHVGSNDVFQNNTLAGTLQEIRSIIDVIRADNPNVTILLAKLIGTTMSTNTGIIALNAQIDGIAAEKSTSASRVLVVDHYTGFNAATDTYDGVHPNAAGEEKMAEKWFNAIMQLTAPGSGGTGTGLRAEYFNNVNLAAPVVTTRIDPQVNFDWGNGSPGAGINADNYSVRWTGEVESPITGNVTFSTVSDDGVRLWVNNVLVINNWTTHAPTLNNSAPVALTAGAKYTIRMEYFENAIGAVARLLWSYAGQSQQAIPQGRLYPSASGTTDVVAPSVPGGLASSGITQTSFTLSWNASTDAVGVTGYEVFRNGISAGTTATLSMTINAGLSPGTTYTMTVRARDAAGNWSAQSAALNVTTQGTSGGGNGTGLQAEYFNNVNLAAPAVVTRVDAQVNFDWGNGSPGTGINADNYSVRWTGEVESPVTGNVTFSTVSDDGVRLWINDVLIINNWTTHAPMLNNSTPVALAAGAKYTIRMEYFESAIGAVARLLWSYAGQSQQAIPQTRLYPSATPPPPPPPDGSGTGLQAEYYNNVNLAAPVVTTRIDPQVNFDWGNGSPGAGINADNYSVRWSGEVESPVTGNVVFSTLSDDGVRLWVNDLLIINNWGVHAPTLNNSAPVALTAGTKYAIRMEYFESGIGAVARLLWSYAGQSQQAIPQRRLYPAGAAMRSAASLAAGNGKDRWPLEEEDQQLFDEVLSVYPNPLHDGHLHIRIYSSGSASAGIAIYAPDSRLLFNQCVTLAKGENHLTVPAAELSEGLNLVVIRRDDGGLVSKRVMVGKR